MPTHIVACNWLRLGKFVQFLNGVWSLLLAVSADVNLHEENRLQAALNGVSNSRCDGSIIVFCDETLAMLVNDIFRRYAPQDSLLDKQTPRVQIDSRAVFE